MQCSPGDRLNSFALVAYIPGPIGDFVDRLSRELAPGCFPHPHITILPPRPLHTTVERAAAGLRSLARETPLVRVGVELVVEVFAISSVVFLSIGEGASELLAMHDRFNTGDFQMREAYPYHPHITVAQNVEPGKIDQVREQAQRHWQEYRLDRSFLVAELTFVQATTTNLWVDLASYPLGVPEPVRR